MRSIGLLIKNYFLCFLGNLAKNSKNKSKYMFAGGIALFISAIFVFAFTSLAIESTNSAVKAEMPELALYVSGTMTLMFIMIMTITKSSMTPKSTDEEALLALPVKRSAIVISKICYDYLFDLLIVVATLLPAYIVYYYIVPGSSVFLILRGLLIIMLLPMLSSAIGYFIGLFFKWLSSHFKYYSIFQSIFTIIFLVVFLVGYYGMTYFMGSDGAENSQFLLNFLPLKWMVGFVGDNNIWYLLIILAVALIPFVVYVIVKTALLGHSIGRYRSRKKALKFTKSSPTKALYKREVSRYFGVSVYVVNTIFGAIVLIILGIILASLGKNFVTNILSAINMTGIMDYFPFIVLAIVSLSTATICTTAPSISLEGKTLWILKAHPVSTKAIFDAKILLNMTIAIVPIMISSVLVCIATGFIYLPLMIIIPMLISICVAIIGLYANLLFPRFDWDSEVTPVKQGISIIIAMGLGLILTVVPFAIYIALYQYFTIVQYSLILGGFYLVLASLLYLFINKKGRKMFEQLNN